MAESVEFNLNDELIVALHFQSMEAHKRKYAFYVTSAPSTDVLIFAFKGSWEVRDWYDDDDDHFGETDVGHHRFPSLLRIGEGRLAKVNKAFLQRFDDLLTKSGFKTEVEKAMKEGKKILVTGHSSGGAIASFATLWMLEEYARKRAIEVPIRCITFGSPLIGDGTLSHAVRRQNWATRFTHFVMEHDIVPRLISQNIRSRTPTRYSQILPTKSRRQRSQTPKLPKIFHKKTPGKPVPRDRSVEADQAVAFSENVMVKASVAARNHAFNLMEPTTNSLTEKLSNDYVKISPYTPFGTYIFCIRDEAQLVVESPDAVLQLLFYFLQLTDEHQDLADFALNTLDENLSYEEELNKGLHRVNLKEFNASDATAPVFELGEQARWCLMAAEEADRRKKENEKQIDASRRNNGLGRPRTGGKNIEDMLDGIRGYKERHAEGHTDYYDAFKLQDKRQDDDHEDFKANINRLELMKIWDEVIEMLRRNDLPDEFEGREEWVRLGTEFRRLVEPLDIANYYRHSKGSGYMGFRPKRYKFTQRWYEHANVMGFESISGSSFMGVVEELRSVVDEHRKRLRKDLIAWKNKSRSGNPMRKYEAKMCTGQNQLCLCYEGYSHLMNHLCLNRD
ncbi:LOW QUALITY PROTEIN: hypothetical protein OSB04_004109 [Centaurea solstitialis]|uniref:Uncharacterized protein n=1 Tax=Centaurea solstitialis TaxID=347529 RepID=A0AA38U3L9_9ASTR|nr:LOW QUALITY PROTEIN: hypothetical protein OSB04_004109 [Centaurea solstitialis]